MNLKEEILETEKNIRNLRRAIETLRNFGIGGYSIFSLIASEKRQKRRLGLLRFEELKDTL